MADGKVNPVGGSGEKEGRDSACTPKWLADLIGKVDLDVASNKRAHIQAAVSLTLEQGDNGIHNEKEPRSYSQHVGSELGKEHRLWGVNRSAIVREDTVVFCNPPYARGQVIRWVKHWRSTRFIFLLRWDPSTEWFSELIPHCTHVWFPGRRINFEPPPGVKFSNNPFPHALYLRDPSEELMDRLASAGYLMPIDQDLLDFYVAGDNSGGDDERDSDGDDAVGDEGQDDKGGVAVGGGGTGEGIREVPKKLKWGIDYSKIQKDAGRGWDWGYMDWQKAAREAEEELVKRAAEIALKRGSREDEYAKRSKEAGGCGACVDCKYGLGWCVFKTEKYERDFYK